MWIFRKLREIEWIWSLWILATTSGWFWVAVGAVLAVLSAVGTALYSFASWINKFGAGGWVLAGAAAIMVAAIVIGTVAWAWERVRIIRSGRGSSAPAVGRGNGAERERNELIRSINRSVFLLIENASEDATYRALWKALNTVPPDDTHDGKDDEELLQIVGKINDYIMAILSDLTPTRWVAEFSSELKEVEYKADVDLRKADLPSQFQPMIYRAFYIAMCKRRTLDDLLRKAIQECDFSRDNIRNLLRDQRRLHSA